MLSVELFRLVLRISEQLEICNIEFLFGGRNDFANIDVRIRLDHAICSFVKSKYTCLKEYLLQALFS